VQVGVQQQRQQPLAALMDRCRTAAKHVIIIKSHLEVITGFDNSHNAMGPFNEGTQGLTGSAEMAERCPQRMSYDYGQ
jgi:hypothetical protein